MSIDTANREALLAHWPKSLMNDGDDDPATEFDLHGIVKFCGCGCPEVAAVWLRDLLKLLDAGGMERFRKIDAHFKAGEPYVSTPLYWLIMYWLDAEGWTEHGGGVSGAWLTDKGRAAIIALDLLIASETP